MVGDEGYIWTVAGLVGDEGVHFGGCVANEGFVLRLCLELLLDFAAGVGDHEGVDGFGVCLLELSAQLKFLLSRFALLGFLAVVLSDDDSARWRLAEKSIFVLADHAMIVLHEEWETGSFHNRLIWVFGELRTDNQPASCRAVNSG